MSIFSNILRDFRAARDRDPAARGLSGAIAIWLCYPGFKAVVAYRFLHPLHRVPGLRLPTRVLSQMTRFFTGCEIHPAAQLGPGCFIDHASGVVIGETAILGANVTLYQGVTLGGTGKETGKRHPTLGDNVVVGAGAKILGNIVVGDDAKVGAGSVVVRAVPPGCTVAGVPAVIVRRDGKRVADEHEIPLDHTNLPNPLLERLRTLECEVRHLRTRLHHVEEGGSLDDDASRAAADEYARELAQTVGDWEI
jgi:serine O-acetyltransferase